MHETADLQDKMGQGEVDIPAREMLANMLLELKRPRDALVEYEHSLQLSPNRFNGLFNAGMAAEGAGNRTKARKYYTMRLELTDNGIYTTRPKQLTRRRFSRPALQRLSSNFRVFAFLSGAGRLP